MLEEAFVFMFLLLLAAAIYIVLLKGKIYVLSRSIFIADQKLDLIRKVEKWSEEANFSPFDKGVDPHDVYTNLEDAKKAGKHSLEKEALRYGDIEQL